MYMFMYMYMHVQVNQQALHMKVQKFHLHKQRGN